MEESIRCVCSCFVSPWGGMTKQELFYLLTKAFLPTIPRTKQTNARKPSQCACNTVSVKRQRKLPVFWV